MKLTKISIRNLKGRTGTLDLLAINFLVGANWIGKTTWLDAIRLVLIGYLPERGKLPRATFGLSSGRDMEVSAETDTGLRIRRRWFLKGDSVKTEEDLPPELFESNGDVLLVMMDAAEYFAKSARGRTDYVAAHVSGETELTNAEILAQVAEAAGMTTERKNPLIKAILAFTGTKAEELMRGELSAQEWIEAAIAGAAEHEKSSKDYAVVMEKAAQGLSALRAQDAQTVNPETLDQKRFLVVAEINRLQNEKATHMAAFDVDKANRKRRDELAQQLSGKPAAVANKDRLALSLDAKEHELASIQLPDKEATERAIEAERTELVTVASFIEQIRQVSGEIVKNESDLLGITAKTTCPYCGASGEGWKTLKTVEINAALKEGREKLAVLIDQRGQAQARAANLSARISNAKGAVVEADKLAKEVAALRADLNEANRALETIALREKELAEVPTGDTASLAGKISETQVAIDAKNADLAAIDEQRKALMGRLAELKRLADAETARDEARKDQQAAKKAAEKLREIQAKIVEDLFQPLLSTANSLFGCMLKTPIAYNPANAELGTWRDGVWVDHKALSGVEQLLTYSAIQAALASKSPYRLIVLDEMLRAHGPVFKQVVALCKEAVRSGRIDGFIGTIPGEAKDYGWLADKKDCQVVEIV